MIGFLNNTNPFSYPGIYNARTQKSFTADSKVWIGQTSNNLTYDLHPEVFLVECVPPSPPKPAFNIEILCKNGPQWSLHEGKEED
jgi:hypothetical protein